MVQKIVSWNVNSLKACIDKGFYDPINEICADIICLQETRTNPIKLDISADYNLYWNCGQNKGYGGVLTITKQKPIRVIDRLGEAYIDAEGRFLALEYDDYFVINIYSPSTIHKGLERKYFRVAFDEILLQTIESLQNQKPIIMCGDFNVAHEYLDMNEQSSNVVENPFGFLDDERNNFGQILDLGFVDAFRYLYPNKRVYTWFCPQKDGKRNDFGSRLDYFIVQDELKDKIKDVTIHESTYGSDHCPIVL